MIFMSEKAKSNIFTTFYDIFISKPAASTLQFLQANKRKQLKIDEIQQSLLLANLLLIHTYVAAISAL